MTPYASTLKGSGHDSILVPFILVSAGTLSYRSGYSLYSMYSYSGILYTGILYRSKNVQTITTHNINESQTLKNRSKIQSTSVCLFIERSKTGKTNLSTLMSRQ